MGEKDFIKILSELKIEGFSLEKKIGAVSWERKNLANTDRVTLGYRRGVNGFVVYPPTAGIIFDEIEIALRNYALKSKLDLYFTEETILTSFGSLEGIDFSVFENEIAKDPDSKIIFIEISKLIKIGCFSFFEQNNSLDKLAAMTAQKSPKDMVPIIQGAQLFLKAIMILKVAGHADYEKKRDEYYEVLKSQALKNANYVPYQKAFEGLFLS